MRNHENDHTTIRFTSLRSAENFHARTGSRFPILRHKNIYSVKFKVTDHKTKPPRKNPQLKSNNLN